MKENGLQNNFLAVEYLKNQPANIAQFKIIIMNQHMTLSSFVNHLMTSLTEIFSCRTISNIAAIFAKIMRRRLPAETPKNYK